MSRVLTDVTVAVWTIAAFQKNQKNCPIESNPPTHWIPPIAWHQSPKTTPALPAGHRGTTGTTWTVTVALGLLNSLAMEMEIAKLSETYYTSK